jgi:4-phospho-D-threonate 3-dehydrogenase / 4-phospho-D-erythronate 3-dehydrogenase
MNKPLCALTMGDPSGIGPEVVLKTLISPRAQKFARMVVIGYPEVFLRDISMLGLNLDIHQIDDPSQKSDNLNTVDIISPPEHEDIPLSYGIVDARCGYAAGHCIQYSAKLALSGEIDTIVTAPINKESLALAGYQFPGHTEFYQHLTGATDIAMMLTLGNLRIVHVTTHTAICDVPPLIKKERIVRVTKLLFDAIVLLGIPKPHLAVSGLNPHAGEGGMFGKEEFEEIIPAVEKLKTEGIDVTGPLPPDTVFARAFCGEFDGVVAMFHDQGHIALKLVGFKLGREGAEVGGVNVTLGLPIIRTSVDHGTAFDIAGKGIASPLSMIEAVEMAAELAKGKIKIQHN